MSKLSKIQEQYEKVVTENVDFTKGKDIEYLADYLLKMSDRWKKTIENAKKRDDYAIMHSLVGSGLNDLQRIKKRLDQISKTGV